MTMVLNARSGCRFCYFKPDLFRFSSLACLAVIKKKSNKNSHKSMKRNNTITKECFASYCSLPITIWKLYIVYVSWALFWIWGNTEAQHQSGRKSFTFLASLLAGAIDVIFELNAHLSLVRLVPNEGVLQQLICWRPLSVILHQAAFNKAKKLLGPGGYKKGERKVREELNTL